MAFLPLPSVTRAYYPFIPGGNIAEQTPATHRSADFPLFNTSEETPQDIIALASGEESQELRNYCTERNGDMTTGNHNLTSTLFIMGEVEVQGGPGGEGDTAMQEIISNGGGRIQGSLEQSIDLEWAGGQ